MDMDTTRSKTVEVETKTGATKNTRTQNKEMILYDKNK